MKLIPTCRRYDIYTSSKRSAGQSMEQTHLSDKLVRKGQVQNVLEHEPARQASCENSKLTGPIEMTMSIFIASARSGTIGGPVRMRDVAITTVDEVQPDSGEEREKKWRSKALSDGSIRPFALDSLSEFVIRGANYYDLQLIPERYTGYQGQDARRVWRAIYEENCFGLTELNLMSAKSPSLVSLPDTMIEPLHEDGVDSDSQCLEKRLYYKIISGMSHSTVALVGRNKLDDEHTLDYLSKITDIAKDVGRFDESVLFRGENANVLREEFKTHFRNVTRIMDCVGCDKCRLWGKIQTTGVATALKVLFELDDKALSPQSHLLQRSEIVAMMNTLYRFSESLKAVDDFRKMWKELDSSESSKMWKMWRRAPHQRHAHLPLYMQTSRLAMCSMNYSSG
ncbi:hypothetical protein DFP72DRAFT_842863 [Ephemerocybe angulata]|uniref:Uncharacterized protein n=1 Tax=Ephemerocybe angulata TaxID=980116 RepID=A0A8H6IBK0_9AGAR|nr:hypothetical protein DFP72DRAFT_842863 [Tulosesus angulatus]